MPMKAPKTCISSSVLVKLTSVHMRVPQVSHKLCQNKENSIKCIKDTAASE